MSIHFELDLVRVEERGGAGRRVHPLLQNVLRSLLFLCFLIRWQGRGRLGCSNVRRVRVCGGALRRWSHARRRSCEPPCRNCYVPRRGARRFGISATATDIVGIYLPASGSPAPILRRMRPRRWVIRFLSVVALAPTVSATGVGTKEVQGSGFC